MTRERPRKSRPRKVRLLVFCEGKKTEFNYFNLVCSESDVLYHFNPQVEPGNGGDALEVVKAAVRERNRERQRREPYDEVWCVLDVEDASRAAKLNEALQLASNEKILVVLSNPSFEVWFIAHFVRTGEAFDNSAAAEAYLEELCWKPEFEHRGYNKRASGHYKQLALVNKSNNQNPVENAKWVLETHHMGGKCQDCNSSTEVYLLVNRLRNPGTL